MVVTNEHVPRRIRAHIGRNMVAYVSLILALGLGSAWAAIELGRNQVKSKHIAPGQVKRADLGRNAVTSAKVADGSLRRADFAAAQLPQGPPGEDATSLFAYIRDAGDLNLPAAVHYGSGVSGVTDADPGHEYMVTFSQSVENCVVQAVPGLGDPPGTASSFSAIPVVSMHLGDAQSVRIIFRNPFQPDGMAADATVDTSFLITAFC